MVEVRGPDVTTSCGAHGRRLRIGTSYVAGIGGPCSPIEEWAEVSMYSNEELDLLRMLRDTVCAGAVGVVPGITLLTFLLLLTAFN